MDAFMPRRLGAPYSEVNRHSESSDTYDSPVGNTLKERLEEAMKGPPVVRAIDLARACGVKPPSVADWLSGRTKRLEGANLLAAAKRLGVRPEWLSTGVGPMRLNQSAHAPTQADSTGQTESPSQTLTLSPDILHEAVALLLFDLDHGGPRTARSASDLVLSLIPRLQLAGGRLAPDEEREFEQQARSRKEGETARERIARTPRSNHTRG
jgi:transcriptional regulator with XRE-family HTH domain